MFPAIFSGKTLAPTGPSRAKRAVGGVVALIVAAILFTVAQAQCATAHLHGRVVAIADGDTLTVLTGTNQTKIRLWGIDCPEKKQAFGTVAKAALSGLTFGRDVDVEVLGTDRYGRTLGLVQIGDKKVNLELVRQGLAWWYRQYAPAAKDLAGAEQAARLAKRGLWADADPVAPWEFRHGQRQR